MKIYRLIKKLFKNSVPYFLNKMVHFFNNNYFIAFWQALHLFMRVLYLFLFLFRIKMLWLIKNLFENDAAYFIANTMALF